MYKHSRKVYGIQKGLFSLFVFQYIFQLKKNEMKQINNKIIDKRFWFLTLLIMATASSRCIPHMPNFSPLCALCIFGGAHFKNKYVAIVMPLLSVWLSDLFLNNVIYNAQSFTLFYSGWYWQYGTYTLLAMFSFLWLRKNANPRFVFGSSLLATALFFLITNFGCWIGNMFYAQNMSGLLTCYVAGFPFLKNALVGDLVFSLILFGGFYFASKRIPQLRLQYAS
jgi:hypothetical protein